MTADGQEASQTRPQPEAQALPWNESPKEPADEWH